jgi:hypothetical protein
MHKRRWIWLTVLLAGALFLPATPALADGGPPGDDGIVIWNEDYTLEESERLAGDLVVFNGDVTLESDSHVAGSVIVWNGNATVDGTVEKDLVVSGGDATLGASAWVKRDVVCTWNCDLEQEEGARVDGNITEGLPVQGLRLDRWRDLTLPLPAAPAPLTFWSASPGRILGWLLRAIRGVTAILVVAAVAGLVALIWPHQTAQVGRAMVSAPWHSLGLGLLTSVVATALIVALAITVCLSPVAALAALALGVAGLFGWIAVGALVGERLLQALNVRGVAPLWAASLGTLLVTLIGMGLSAAFCLAPLGWLTIIALGCLGLGAVVLTRFGTMPYTPSTASGCGLSHPTPPSPMPPPAEAPEPPESPEGTARGDEM